MWLHRLKQSWPLLLLCFLLGTRWLVTNALPEAFPTLETSGFGSLLAAAAFCLFLIRPGDPVPAHASRPLLQPFGLVLALSGSAVAQALFGRHISSSSAVLAMAFTPVFLALILSTTDRTGQLDLLQLLWPGLCGLLGLLLLIPQPSYRDWRSWATLIAMPLLTAVGASCSRTSVGANEPSQAPAPSRVALFAALGLVVIFAILTLVGRQVSVHPPSMVAVLLDGAGIFLGVLALLRLGPLPWSAQFLLVPLLGLLESLGVLRPSLDLRSSIGLVLIAFGGLRLLFGEPSRAVTYRGLGLADTRKSP